MENKENSPDEKVLIEIWKKIVDVQQHFNDLELRVRNFALVLTGTFLAIGGYAIKEEMFIDIMSINISVSSLIVVAAIVPLFAFYFMDKFWYHRLLDGAVQAGISAEAQLRARGYDISLGSKISEASPIINIFYGKKLDSEYWLLFPKRKMHSRHKMDVFYGVLFVSLVAMAVFLAIGLHPQPSPKEISPLRSVLNYLNNI